jgi:hypothetical protein
MLNLFVYFRSTGREYRGELAAKTGQAVGGGASLLRPF